MNKTEIVTLVSRTRPPFQAVASERSIAISIDGAGENRGCYKDTGTRDGSGRRVFRKDEAEEERP